MTKVSEQLIDSGIISPDDLQQALDGLPDLGGAEQVDALVNALAEQGKLTAYQATAIRDQRHGELLIGRYVVLDKLGAGGMGVVYKAQHRRMKRLVAIKVLSREQVRSADQVARFQREVEAVSRLSHPNIVTAYDADECDAGHFLVMEFVSGCDLARLVQRRGPQTIRQAVHFAVQAARALEYAHAQGIVHRDIKPANLLRDNKGTIKVTDLGLARCVEVGGTASSDITQEGCITGTVDFMAPEQAVNTRHADHRSDIYSLGCTLFFLLTGKSIYDGETIMEKLLAHREQPIPSLCAVSQHVPQELDAVFRRMVAKKPADRHQSMSDVIRDLESLEIDELACTVALGPVAGEMPELDAVTNVTDLDSTAGIEPTTEFTIPSITVQELGVLLVEPSRTQSKLIGSQLQSLGIQRMEFAGDGKMATQVLAEFRPHVVMSSLHLPDMTADSLVESMRADARLRDVPFLLISSDSNDQSHGRAQAQRLVRVLTKPFTLDQLRHAITAVVDQFPSEMTVTHIEPESARVLVVDDSAVARRRMRTLLEEMGVGNITEASNGEQAAHMVDSQSFHLVVTDFEMPRMDGGQLVRHIRTSSPQPYVPVLMVTSATELAIAAGVEEAGVSAVYDKSSDVREIRGILSRIMNWGKR